MADRKIPAAQWYDELEEMGRKIWEALPPERREQHQIDRQRLAQGAQCVCTCGHECVYWVTHLQDVRSHAELWDRMQEITRHYQGIAFANARDVLDEGYANLQKIGRIYSIEDEFPQRFLLGASPPDELGACCQHMYRAHTTDGTQCVECIQNEPASHRCTAWRPAEQEGDN